MFVSTIRYEKNGDEELFLKTSCIASPGTGSLTTSNLRTALCDYEGLSRPKLRADVKRTYWRIGGEVQKELTLTIPNTMKTCNNSFTHNYLYLDTCKLHSEREETTKNEFNIDLRAPSYLYPRVHLM